MLETREQKKSRSGRYDGTDAVTKIFGISSAKIFGISSVDQIHERKKQLKHAAVFPMYGQCTQYCAVSP